MEGGREGQREGRHSVTQCTLSPLSVEAKAVSRGYPRECTWRHRPHLEQHWIEPDDPSQLRRKCGDGGRGEQVRLGRGMFSGNEGKREDTQDGERKMQDSERKVE
jgi:hypothetical protein